MTKETLEIAALRVVCILAAVILLAWGIWKY